MIHLSCDNCGKRLTAKPEYVGRQVKCPGCGHIFIVGALGRGGPGSGTAGFEFPGIDSGTRTPGPMRPRPPASDYARRKGTPAAALVVGGLLVVVALGVVIGVFTWGRGGQRPEESVEEKYEETVAAFGDAQAAPQEEQVPPGVRDLFEALGPKWKRGIEPPLPDFLDAERLVDEVRRAGGLRGISRREQQQAVQGIYVGIEKAREMFSRSFVGFDRYDVKRFKPLGKPGEALLYVRLWWDDDAISTKERFWVNKRDGRWRIYDFEELGSGIRASDGLAELMGTSLRDPQKLRRLEGAVLTIQAVARAIDEEDWEEAGRQLDACSFDGLSDAYESLRLLLRAMAHLGCDNAEEALACCNRAEALRKDMPFLAFVRACAYNIQGEYAKAVQQADVYIDRLAGDVDIYFQLGEALAGLQQPDKAAEAYRKGLDDDPDSVDCLVGLAAVLPEGKKGEIADRFRKLRDKEGNIELVCEALIGQHDFESLEAVAAEFAGSHPGHKDAAYYGASAKYFNDDFAAGAEQVLKAIPQVSDPEERQAFVDLYLDCMMGAGKHLEAYGNAPDAEYAFDYLADDLVWGEAPEAFASLVDAHRQKAPHDPNLAYYEGRMACQQERWSEAIPLLRQALRRVSDERMDVCRDKLVDALYRTGRGLDAYREFGSHEGIFPQLAWLMIDDSDADQLTALIAAHRQREPGDASIPLWEAEASRLRDDHAAVVQTLLRYRQRILSDEDNLWRFERLLIRSLIKLERFDEALREAKRSTQRDDDPWYEALVFAAKGDVANTRAVLKRLVEDGWEPFEFYDDDILGPALRSEPFAELRKEFPEPTPDEDVERP